MGEVILAALGNLLTIENFIFVNIGLFIGIIFGSIPGLSVDIQDTFQGLVLIVVILIQTVGPVIKENLQRAKKRRLAVSTEKV